MIDKISGYVEPIITLIIAMTIIELILPNNKNKKYVMFVCSLVIILSVTNPILKIFDSGIDISETINDIQIKMHDAEYSSLTNYNLNYNIYNSYISKLEENMIMRLEDMGYQVLESKINVNKETFEPENVELRVKYDDGYIQPIVINVFENVSNEDFADMDVEKIKDSITLNYGIERDKIKINQK